MKDYFVVMFLIVLFNGCKKNIQYFPEFDSFIVTVQADGSVRAEFTLKENAYLLRDCGFYMDTSASPVFFVNQIPATYEGDKYYAIFEINNQTERYYFRAWASNENGATFSKILYLDSIVMPSIVAPCSPLMNTIDYGFISGAQNSTWVTQFWYSSFPPVWEIEVTNSNGYNRYYFYDKPQQGIYTTVSSEPDNPGEVYIPFYSGSVSDYIDAGSPVYVNRINADTLEITICNADWLFNTVPQQVNARLRVKSY